MILLHLWLTGRGLAALVKLAPLTIHARQADRRSRFQLDGGVRRRRDPLSAFEPDRLELRRRAAGPDTRHRPPGTDAGADAFAWLTTINGLAAVGAALHLAHKFLVLPCL